MAYISAAKVVHCAAYESEGKKTDEAPARYLLVGDPHLHSTFSDGKLDPGVVLAIAASRCLDFVAFADHNTVSGSVSAREAYANGQAGTWPLMAQEISTDENLHLLVYGLEESLGAIRLIALPGLLRHVLESGGATVVAHPWTLLDRPHVLALIEDLVAHGLIHGVELASAALFYEEFGRWRQTLDWYERALLPFRPAVLGSSDWHEHGHGFVPGLARTLYWGAADGDRDFVAAVRSGETAAWLFPPALLEHGLGSRVTREIDGLLPADWDGLLGTDTFVARLREERAGLAKASARMPAPLRRLVWMHYACGNYIAVSRLLTPPGVEQAFLDPGGFGVSQGVGAESGTLPPKKSPTGSRILEIGGE